MNELKPEAVGADYRGSTRPVSNREAEETRARLIELGQTLRIERIFQQPVETVACVLGYANRVGIIHEIEAVARMDGPSSMFPETPDEVLNIYTDCGTFDPEDRICDEIALKDVTRLCTSTFAQLIGFRFVSPTAFTVRSEVLTRKLDERIQLFCRRQLTCLQKEIRLNTPRSTSIKVTGVTHKLGIEAWNLDAKVVGDRTCGWSGLDARTQTVYDLSLRPGLAASLHDRIILDRCANPETCSICSEGKTHAQLEIPCSNN